jgi:Trk K+ transport system NAD-binding subunit
VAPPLIAETRDHVIICGDNALASRMAEELTARYGLSVTAIVPAAVARHAVRMAALPGVRVLERPELTADTFLAAGLPLASGLAILHQDDLGNLHAALRAAELHPQIRLVIAIFNSGLGERVRTFFADCAVLSESQMAAPSFVAAALGEPAPSHVRIASRTMYVARREDVRARPVVCGLAADADAGTPELLPPDDTASGLVLAVADGTPRDPLARQRRHRVIAALRRLLVSRMGLAFGILTAVLIAGFVLLRYPGGYSPSTALYLAVLDASGDAVANPRLAPPEKWAQFILTFDGLAFLPLVTAAIVAARLPGAADHVRPPLGGHVIVAGLGSVGARVVGQLHDLGVEVVGIDKNPEAAGMPLARLLGIRVIIGQTHTQETLRAAGIESCQAVVSVTDSDIVNLETALNARALAAQPRIVVRLYDDDLAERVQRTVGGTVSRSTSYLAAPAFAAAMLDHQVLRTIAVGRHVLLLAEVPADASTGLAGQQIATVHQPGGTLRVLALRRPDRPGADWSPDPGYRIAPGDRLVVLATRAGLSRILRPEAQS